MASHGVSISFTLQGVLGLVFALVSIFLTKHFQQRKMIRHLSRLGLVCQRESISDSDLTSLKQVKADAATPLAVGSRGSERLHHQKASPIRSRRLHRRPDQATLSTSGGRILPRYLAFWAPLTCRHESKHDVSIDASEPDSQVQRFTTISPASDG